MPSRPMAVLAAVLVNVLYALVPAGRPRELGKLVVAGLLAVTALSRLYLAQDAPSDVLFGVVFGVAIPLAAFRLFTPTTAYPVSYRRGRTAHLDLSGAPAGGDRAGAAGPARRDPGGDQAVRAGGLGRVHADADQGQGRAGDVPVRQAVRGHPPALRPLVQARPHADVRAAGGREGVQHRAPAGAVRGLHAAPHARRRPAGAAAVRDRRDHPGAGVPARHRVLRRRARRSARPTSTTTHRPGAGHRPASSGRPAWPTATSSRPT